MKKESRKDKKSNKNYSAKSSIILIVLFTVVIIASSFIIANFDSIIGDAQTDNQTTVNNVVDSAVYKDDDDELYLSSSRKATGFPISFASNNIKKCAVVNSCIFVMSRDMISCISASGKVKYSNVLNFVDPVMKTSNKYCLVFDRQGNKYMLFDKNGMVRSSESENEAQIITCEVADNGSYLVSSRKSGATSMLTYYSKSGDKIYQWICANEHIVSLAVADNYKSIACAAVNSKSGDIYTKIYYFDINSADNNKNFTVKSSTAMDIFFSSNSSLIAVCNNQRVLFNCKTKDSKPVSLKFASSILSRANDRYGNTAVISKKIDSFDQSELTVYDDKNNIIYSCDVNSDIVDIVCYKRRVYILENNRILLYNSAGEVSDTIDIDSASIGIAFASGKLYRYSQGYLFAAV